MNATENRPRQIPFDAVRDFRVNIHIFRLLQKLLNFMSFFWVQPRDGWERKIPASQTRLRSFPNQLTPPLVTFDRPSDCPFLRIHRLRAGGSLHVAGNTSSHNNVAICNLTVDY